MARVNITSMADALAQEPELEALRMDLAAGRFEKAFAAADEFLLTRRDQRGIDLLAAAFKAAPKTLRPPKSPWGVFLGFCLNDAAGNFAEAGRLARKFSSLPKTYAWMRYYLGSYRLHDGADYGAAADFRAAAQSAPEMWKARAYEAEILLCKGRLPQALAVFDGLLATLERGAYAEALAWRGVLQLWAGRYAGAYADLNRAVESGTPYALGWRGGAHFKLGRAKEALADLRQADSGDQEARCWRAEVLRTLGRKKEALRELEPLLHADRLPNFWAQANAALAGGDAEKLYSSVDPKIRRFIPLKDPLKFFARGLRLGKGLRVPDTYLGAIWMKAK